VGHDFAVLWNEKYVVESDRLTLEFFVHSESVCGCLLEIFGFRIMLLRREIDNVVRWARAS
jgi:hypothetical protein